MPLDLMSLPPEEAERLAFAEGFTGTAALFARLADAERERDTLAEEVENLRDLQRETQNHAEYRAFFEECFEHLAGHYPAPSVTSDYDKSVIFETLDRAEGGQ